MIMSDIDGQSFIVEVVPVELEELDEQLPIRESICVDVGFFTIVVPILGTIFGRCFRATLRRSAFFTIRAHCLIESGQVNQSLEVFGTDELCIRPACVLPRLVL